MSGRFLGENMPPPQFPWRMAWRDVGGDKPLGPIHYMQLGDTPP